MFIQQKPRKVTAVSIGDLCAIAFQAQDQSQVTGPIKSAHAGGLLPLSR